MHPWRRIRLAPAISVAAGCVCRRGDFASDAGVRLARRAFDRHSDSMTAYLTRWRNVLLGGMLAAILAAFAILTLLPAQNRLTHGFLAYYAAGELIASGADARQLYDVPAFERRVRELSHGTVRDGYIGNTPALAVAWLPLGKLPVESARRLWIWLNVLFVAAIIALSAARLPSTYRLPAVVLLAALFTIPSPAREQMLLGQMYIFLLLLHTLGWRAYERDNDALTGVALGITMMLKLSGWPIGVLLLLRRRWRAVFWAVGTAAAIFLFTLPWIGVEAWREAVFVQMPASVAMPAAKHSAFQTVSGLWQHLFLHDADFNPHPVADLPWLAVAGSLLTAAAACAALLLHRLSAQVQYAAALVLTVLLSPLAEQYHYVLVLLPFALLCMHGYFTDSRRLGLVLLIIALLLATPVGYEEYSPGWWALLDYPRLAAGWMIFFALISAARLRTDRAPGASNGEPDQGEAQRRH